MKDDKSSMHDRVDEYNKHYKFLENPNEFHFEYNPHRLIVKNYALRNNEKDIYEAYVNYFFPDKAKEELIKFSSELENIRHFDNEELAAWLKINKVKVVQSDIHYTDADSIFNMVYVPESESADLYVMEDEGFILNMILPKFIPKNSDKTWINIKVPKI